MKYNPKFNDEMAGLPGLSEIHPYQPEATVQGALKLMHHLQEILAEIAGLPGASVSPKAGAESEFVGMLMTRAYHLSRGDTGRTTVLIPDSAHGTNPASAAVAGFKVVSLPTDADGNTDLEALRAACGDDIAGFMLTQPSTLGPRTMPAASSPMTDGAPKRVASSPARRAATSMPASWMKNCAVSIVRA